MTRLPSHMPECLQDARMRARQVLPQVLLDIVGVVPAFQELTEVWHHQMAAPIGPATCMLTLAKHVHFYNFRLWHTEDKARRPDAPDRLIAECKRSIDADNQQRHDRIERLDEVLLAYLYEQHQRPQPQAELHSETPGNLIDRLSILALKMYHMAFEADRQDATAQQRQGCRRRLAILEAQCHDLWACLSHLCVDLWEGRKRVNVYQQFKMYNDPDLNPEIYRHAVSRQAPGASR